MVVEKWVDTAFRSDITDSYPIGFPNHLREDVKEEKILEKIEELNKDDTVSGIMTQVDERMTGINKANKK